MFGGSQALTSSFSSALHSISRLLRAGSANYVSFPATETVSCIGLTNKFPTYTAHDLLT